MSSEWSKELATEVLERMRTAMAFVETTQPEASMQPTLERLLTLTGLPKTDADHEQWCNCIRTLQDVAGMAATVATIEVLRERGLLGGQE